MKQLQFLVFFGWVLSETALAGTLCKPGEETVFNCSAGKKLVSICASKGWTPSSGSLQYRYGTASKIELTLPSDLTTPPKQSARSKGLMFSGGGGATLRFKSGEFDYVVFTAIGSWGETAGVSIEKGGKRKKRILCKDKEESILGPEFFQKGGFEADPADFELP